MPPHNTEDTKAILDRREFLIRSALAAAGGVVASGCKPAPRTCLSIVENVAGPFVHAEFFCLGEYCGNNLGDAKTVMVIHWPVPDKDTAPKMEIEHIRAAQEQHQFRMKALKDGFGEKLTVVETNSPPLSGDDPYMYEEYYMIEAKDFGGWLDGAKADLVISLCGLPENYDKMAFWQKADAGRPKLVLVDAWPFELESEIKSGLISAVLVSNPEFRLDWENLTTEDVTSQSPHELFNMRYILIDAKNINEVKRKYPKMFRAGEKGREDKE